MNKKHTLTIIVALVLVASFALAGVAYAQIKLVNPLNAWDRGANPNPKWENGNVQLWSDPSVWVPFYEVLDFDGTDFDTSGFAAGCAGADKASPWAGELEIGLYHEDNNPAGAPGFQSTRNWKLLDCTVVEGGIPPIADPTIAGVTLSQTLGPDVVDPGLCGGNCTSEIINRYFVNLDTDCDGNVNAGVPARVCLYWEAQPPALVVPSWGGNIQGRINTLVNGVSVGDKTINFAAYGPNAVAVRSFAASAVAPTGLALVTILGGLGAAGLYLRRRDR